MVAESGWLHWWLRAWCWLWLSASGGHWNLGLGSAVQKLGSALDLGSALTAALAGVVTLQGVSVLLRHGDVSGNAELSLSNLAGLALSGSSGNGLLNLSLVSDDVLVWDGNLSSTNAGSGRSRLG